jgi:hypothetical protein
MGAAFSSTGGTLVFGLLLVALYIGYRAVLPKPLPGIPYNRDAAGKLLGDVPEMMGYVMRTKRIFVSDQSINYMTWLYPFCAHVAETSIRIVLAYFAQRPPPKSHYTGLYQAWVASMGGRD